MYVYLILIIISEHNVTYTFAKEYASNRDENNDVPLILHFLWVGQPIPEKYFDAILGFEKINTHKVRGNIIKMQKSNSFLFEP